MWRGMRIPLSEKVYTWWELPRRDWDPGIAAAGSITSGCRGALQESVSDFRITRDARGWERPSDPRFGDGDAGGVALVVSQNSRLVTLVWLVSEQRWLTTAGSLLRSSFFRPLFFEMRPAVPRCMIYEHPTDRVSFLCQIQ